MSKNEEHNRYRLNFNKAEMMLHRKLLEDDKKSFYYIYLFAFDNEDRLIWGYILHPDDPPSALDLIISLAEELSIDYGIENIYFIMKVKRFKIDDNDMRQRDKAYHEGFIDMMGTMKRVEGFIEAWKGFEEREGGDNPALKRYTVEFVNHRLGLPFRYYEEQRNLDMHEILK